jgi:succinate dehydrogenase hydrophobic anchor subunit
MFSKSLGQLEKHAFYLLFILFIIVLVWHGMWGLVDAVQEYLYLGYGIKKIHFNVATLAIVVLIIGLHPEILKKL